jgi:acetolactate synthase-1/3 small subunit
MKIQPTEAERHVLTVTVDNEAGILAKIAGLFTARGYNIDSLTVADITEDHAVSRITIVTNGPPPVIDQIIAQLERLVPVHKVTDLTESGTHVERELALVKVAGRGDSRAEAQRIADAFQARIIDDTATNFVFELTETSDRIDSFVAQMREHGLVEAARSGVVGMIRGADEASSFTPALRCTVTLNLFQRPWCPTAKSGIWCKMDAETSSA